MNDRVSKSASKDSAPKGQEQREHFRVNAEIRISAVALGEASAKPWAYCEEGGISPLIGPGEEALAKAQERLKTQPLRKVNLSAGGFRTGYGGETAWDRAPEVGKGDPLSVVLELQLPGELEAILVHLVARVVWVEQTAKWTYMAAKFDRVPTGVERVLTQFIMEVERRRLRPS